MSRTKAINKQDFRIFRETNGWITVRDVFYDAKGDVVYISDGFEPASPSGENFEEFERKWYVFMDALSKPMLEFVNGEYKEVKE